MEYIRHNYYVHQAWGFYLFLGEIILKLCDIIATHPGKAGARMESLGVRPTK